MGSRTPTILIVDDEDMVLSSLRGVFALQTDYDVHEANSPHAAIERVDSTPIDVVISDFLMPEMNGIELLKEIKKRQPETARVLLTGYADKENAIKAINDVGLYHYLEKPWDNEALLNIVRNALSEKGLRAQLRRKVDELDALLNQHGQLEEQHESLKRELEMAAAIQRSLLPETFPSIEGYTFARLYEPCDAIGGDFFDIVAREHGAVLLVSDVIGHGVRAALSTMMLKAAFQEAADSIATPVELLDEMNRRLHAVLPSGMYVAAAVFFLETDSSDISYANAGLPYPFVLREEGRVDEIALAGPPLGLFETGVLPYECRRISTRPGNVVLAGSDGIGSIVAPGGEMFEGRRASPHAREALGRAGRARHRAADGAGPRVRRGRPAAGRRQPRRRDPKLRTR